MIKVNVFLVTFALLFFRIDKIFGYSLEGRHAINSFSDGTHEKELTITKVDVDLNEQRCFGGWFSRFLPRRRRTTTPFPGISINYIVIYIYKDSPRSLESRMNFIHFKLSLAQE